MDTITQTKVRTRVGTAVLGAAIILAAAAGLVIKSQDNGLAIGASGYDFGKVMTKESVEKVFILQNTESKGDYKLAVLELAGAFAVNKATSTCQDTLAAGKACKLAVKFTPTEAIKYKATLGVRYVVGGKTKNAAVKLQGEGVASAMDTACLDSDVTENNFAGMPINGYKFVNVFKLGHVKGLNPTTGVFMEADDKCWNEKRILEYYCDAKKGTVSWNSYDCPSGCADGACQEVICPEAPANANSLSINGVCSWECLSPWENKDGKKENGCECNLETKQGCPISQCYDSDGGVVLEKMGMTQGLDPNTNAMTVKTDFCSGTFQVVEYACQGDYLMVDAQAPGEPPLSSAGTFCPKGTYCKDNACQPCQKKDLGYATCQNIGGKYYAADMVLGDDCSIYATNSVDGLKLCGNTADSCVEGKCVAKPASLWIGVWSGFPESQTLLPGQERGLAGFGYTENNGSIKVKQFKFLLKATDAAKAVLTDWQLKINGVPMKGKLVGDEVVFDNLDFTFTNFSGNVMKLYATVKKPLGVKDSVQIQLVSADKVVAENAADGTPVKVLGDFPMLAPVLIGDQPEVATCDVKATGKIGCLKLGYDFYYSSPEIQGADCQLYYTNSDDAIDFCGTSEQSCVEGVCQPAGDSQVKIYTDVSSPQGTVIAGYGKELARIDVAAAGTEDVRLASINLSLNGTAVAGMAKDEKGFFMKTGDGVPIKVNSAYFLEKNQVEFTLMEDIIIPAGTIKVLKIYGNTTGVKVNDVLWTEVKTAKDVKVVDLSGKKVKVSSPFPIKFPSMIY